MTKKEKNLSKDPKYLGIPNICFSLVTVGDKREKKFSKQRLRRGFDESETWCLTTTIANFIIPRLEEYNTISDYNTERGKKLKKDTKIVLEAMKLIARNDGLQHWNELETKIVNKGVKKLSRIFLTLWW